MTRRRPHRTNTNRSHLAGVIASVLLALLGFASIGLGAYAWTQDRSEAVLLNRGVDAALSPSPMFDPGTTVFAQGDKSDPAEPSFWNCAFIRDGRERPLLVRPDFDAIGSRVLRGEPYVPVVTVGKSGAGDFIRCNPPEASDQQLVVMPTDVGVRPVPLAFVVAGIASLGIAGLTHPKGRGVRRFGA